MHTHQENNKESRLIISAELNFAIKHVTLQIEFNSRKGVNLSKMKWEGI